MRCVSGVCQPPLPGPRWFSYAARPACSVYGPRMCYSHGGLAVIQVEMIAALAADELERAGVAAFHPAVHYAGRLASELGGLAVAGLSGKRGASVSSSISA